MNIKKSVAGFMIFGIMLVSVGLISAGWFSDLFTFGEGDGGEGELDTSQFDATVSLSNAPARIVAFRPTIDVNPISVSTGNGEVGPVAGSTVDAQVTFIVEDPNGPNDLPGLTGPAISVGPVSGAGNVYVIITAPTSAPAGSGVTRVSGTGDCIAVSCSGGGNPNCNAITDDTDGTDYTLQKQYTCDVTMNYYDAPSPDSFPASSKNNVWTIRAEIKDDAGNTDTADSALVDADFNGLACTGLQDCDYIDYWTTSAIDTAGSSIAWTGLGVSATDTPNDAPLTLNNWGNTQVIDLQLTGEDLVGDLIVGSIMEVEAFSAGPAAGGVDSGACGHATGGGSGGVELIGGTGVTVLRDIGYTAGGADTADLHFCAWAAVDPLYLTGPTDTSYHATVVEGNNWNVIFNS